MGFTEKEGLYRRHNRLWHVMVGLASLAVGYFVMQRSGSKSGDSQQQFIFGECLINGILFLLAFALNFGMTMWVTFVAGLVMFKNLPTHTFGYIQSKLFPFYFLIGAATGLTMLLVTVSSTGDIYELSGQQKSVLFAMAIIFLTNVLNGVSVGPRSTSVMFERHRLEKESEDKDSLDSNLQYKALKKKFGKLHGVSALLNIFSLGAACFILYWIATQLHQLSG